MRKARQPSEVGPSLSGSILRIYHKIVMLYDVEVRFDCASSRRLAQNEARQSGCEHFAWYGTYYRTVMLYDVETF